MPTTLSAAAGSVKGLTSQQLADLDCHVILGNTYHLANKPGPELVADMGGLHGFINWPRGMLTDSGGFQVHMLAGWLDGLSMICAVMHLKPGMSELHQIFSPA